MLIDLILFKSSRIDLGGLSVIGVVGVSSAFFREQDVVLRWDDRVSARCLGLYQPVHDVVCDLQYVGLELTCLRLVIKDPGTGSVFTHYCAVRSIESKLTTCRSFLKDLLVQCKVSTIQQFFRIIPVLLENVYLCPRCLVVDLTCIVCC